METYQHDFGRLKEAFARFLQNLPFYGAAILCGDDPHVREILPRVTKPVVIYGTTADCSVRAEAISHEGGRMRFRVLRASGKPLEITLNLPGRHNVLNALAAIAVGMEVGVSDKAILEALAEFRGVGRRFQRCGEVRLEGGGAFTLVDDYGHHPAEMAATLEAARGAFPKRRIVLAFQPHRYTRTRDLFADFVRVLSSADALLLAEVYAAGEPPIAGADGRSLERALRAAGKVEPVFVADVAAMPAAIRRAARDGDVVLNMGAGSIGGVPAQLA
jgi:UDP-N-acetylmuramate--alanine ligase